MSANSAPVQAPAHRVRPEDRPAPPGLSAVGRLVRQADPDRYLAALMAAPDRREALFAVYAFAAEVAKTREVVSEAMLGQIRLQWWADALEEIAAGKPARAHEVVTPLKEAIDRFAPPMELFERYVRAREVELEADAPFETLADLEAYARDTAGSVLALTAIVEGASADRAAAWGDSLGTAWGLTGLVRATPFLAAQRRTALPTALLAAGGVTPGILAEGPAVSATAAETVRRVCRQVCERANDLVMARPAGGRLPACRAHRILLSGHLKRLAAADYDPAAARVQTPPPWRLATLSLARLTGRL